MLCCDSEVSLHSLKLGKWALSSNPGASSGSEFFPLLICLDAIKFVKNLPSAFTFIEYWTKGAKGSLPVDVCHSKRLLLKLPNV